MILEINEGAITTRPADLYNRVQEMRGARGGLALEDGVQPSIRLPPSIPQADIIKLDLRLLKELPEGEVARIVHAAEAEVDRRGSMILAEGIETEEQVEMAPTMVPPGQGWLFGHPSELPHELPTSPRHIPIFAMPEVAPAERTLGTRSMSSLKPTNRGTKRMLLRISRQFENHAADLRERPVILSTLQTSDHMSAKTRSVYDACEPGCAGGALRFRDGTGAGAGDAGLWIAEEDP